LREFQYIHHPIGKQGFKSSERIMNKFNKQEKKNLSDKTQAGIKKLK